MIKKSVIVISVIRTVLKYVLFYRTKKGFCSLTKKWSTKTSQNLKVDESTSSLFQFQGMKTYHSAHYLKEKHVLLKIWRWMIYDLQQRAIPINQPPFIPLIIIVWEGTMGFHVDWVVKQLRYKKSLVNERWLAYITSILRRNNDS